MTDPHFIHLRLHTEYSVTDGLVRVGEAVKRARESGMPALGLSDLSNTFGWVKFYRAARGAGIKPIFGCDVWVTNAADRNRPSRLLLLVQHREGYRRLCDLLTRAYLENLHRGRAEVDPAWLRRWHRRPAGAVGRRQRQRRAGDSRRQAGRRTRGGRSVGRAVSRALLSGTAALRPAACRTPDRRSARHRRGAEAAVGGHPSDPVHAA